MRAEQQNADPEELAKFDDTASDWWDPAGKLAPLHRINPLRLDYIVEQVGRLDGQSVLDVGCGGGLLAEGLAARGARVTGIDLSEASLEVARDHAQHSALEIDYQCRAVEALAATAPSSYDVVACLEVLEHIPDPAATAVACAALTRPGGHVIFSTLNRNARSWLLGIVAAEYVLRLLPRGTHEHRRFIRPAELTRWLRPAGATLTDLTGLGYQPITGTYRLQRDVSVNYLAHYYKGQGATR